MKFIEFITNTTTFGSEMVSAVYDKHGATGCVIEDRDDLINNAAEYGDWDYIDDDVIGNMPNAVQVKAYFDTSVEHIIQAVKKEIKGLTEFTDLDLGSLEVITNIVCDEDWKDEWKKYYKTFSVGDKLTVRPYWEKDIVDGKKHITLDPGMAFGNGTHETTFMCLEFLEQLVSGGEFVYDVGCGTGILAIGAVLLSAQKSVAIDRDSVAVQVAKRNIKMNNLENLVDVKIGDLLYDETKKADIIIANIIADVIIPFSKTAYDMLNDCGIFISSGIIKGRVKETMKAIEGAGFSMIDVKSMGAWTAIAAVKR